MFLHAFVPITKLYNFISWQMCIQFYFAIHFVNNKNKIGKQTNTRKTFLFVYVKTEFQHHSLKHFNCYFT